MTVIWRLRDKRRRNEQDHLIHHLSLDGVPEQRLSIGAFTLSLADDSPWPRLAWE
ncbi:hypothetical protein PIB30_051885 [Stylosanthes scabra]|uniref:Uncharacterized protein n=1 Tax=Stylosanthes scabra TaxID=79078 RepID=A0ABU6UJJ6_9FABA|nr:hypothetical protein [Stylosanthes scabra]